MMIIIIIIIIYVPIAMKSGRLDLLETLSPVQGLIGLFTFFIYIILTCICLFIIIHTDSNSKI